MRLLFLLCVKFADNEDNAPCTITNIRRLESNAEAAAKTEWQTVFMSYTKPPPTTKQRSAITCNLFAIHAFRNFQNGLKPQRVRTAKGAGLQPRQ